MKLKKEIVEKFAEKLLPEARVKAFTSAIMNDDASKTVLAWTRDNNRAESVSATVKLVPELPEWAELYSGAGKPGSTPEHENGDYYCADLTSIIFGTAISAELEGARPVVTDLCAAPGGKSLLAWRAYHPALMVSNEVVQKRVRILISNMKRCAVTPVGIFSRRVVDLAHQFGALADVLIVDAPCSAQSLGAKADFPFHKSTIKGNAKRQRGILEKAGKMVRAGGYIKYITCTYSLEENEKAILWFLKRNPHFEVVPVSHLAALQSEYSAFPSYRIWPDQGLGRGGFLCVLRCCTEQPERNREDWPTPLWSSDWLL